MRVRVSFLQRLSIAVAMVPTIASAQSPAAAGGERFGVDPGRVEEKRLGDGTVIVRLNGEGMEKIVLSNGGGRPQAICASALERPLARTGVAADFRGLSHRKAERDAIDR